MSATQAPRMLADRFDYCTLLGQGGMGEVWRVYDPVLERFLAMKVLRVGTLDDSLKERFVGEARVVAKLQHPGIVPVHDMGTLADGRLWFTMQEVRGHTFDRSCAKVHRAWRMGSTVTAEGLGFRRLLEMFLRVCEAVAYAHSQGVLHRDIKPTNIMVGEFGEVQVLDWGLAKQVVLSSLDDVGAASDLTGHGMITGTLKYMAPEQARAENEHIGPPADVHALGALLYEIITERPPRLAPTSLKLLIRVAQGSPVAAPSTRSTLPGIDEALDRICLRALEADPSDRYPDAGALLAEMSAWLDGAQRRERAIELVKLADDALAASSEAELAAAELDAEAHEAEGAFGRFTAPEEKHQLWALQDRAQQQRVLAQTGRARAVHTLRAALSHAPDLPEAHRRLADHFHRLHRSLEKDSRPLEAQAVERDLRTHDVAGTHAAYLRGHAAVTLLTDPPGATATLYRVVERLRRLEPVFERELGETPIRELDVERGNYQIVLELAGHERVVYPFTVERLQHWDAIPPDATHTLPIRLPRAGELEEDDCYVPAGWFFAGSADVPTSVPPRWIWSDAFVAKRDPVTVNQYVAYLNQLLQAGRAEDAEKAAPRMQNTHEPLLEMREGRYTGIRTDRTDELWEHVPRDADVPVNLVTWQQAVDYSSWFGLRAEQPWRLPTELEWQKSARGTDRRAFPWGNHHEAQWSRCKQTSWPPVFASIEAHPLDVSPYGVRGLGGNVGDWVLDHWPTPPAQRHSSRILTAVEPGERQILKGGVYAAGPIPIAQRNMMTPMYRGSYLGFRLVRRFA